MVNMGICAVLFFIALCSPVRGDKSDNTAKILILGAGAAGLKAARTLKDQGIDDFIIIEGADRIGGRVHDAQFGGRTVELGPAWAPPAGSETVRIVKELNLARQTSNYDSLIFRDGTGQNVTEEAFERYDTFEPAVEEVMSLRDRMNENDDIPDMSQRSALRHGGWEPEGAIDHVIEWFDYDFEYGDSTDVSSTKQSEDFGVTYFIKDSGGLKKIFNNIAGFLWNDPAFNSTHLRLNQKVKTIDYSKDISVVVTCEDGTTYTGEYVLVTFSIGVLQRHLVEFTPKLPEWKEVVIDKMRMSSYTQVYLTFPNKFWDDVEWIVHASDRKGYYPIFLNFQATGFFPSGTPMLMAHITGAESRRVEAQPSSKTKAEIEAVLRIMYGASSPNANDILVTDWSKNPLTEGAYSNWPVDVSNDCWEKLQSRVHRVFFAGEATSENFLGYVEGGLESGKREAEKIKSCMDNFKECPLFEGAGLVCEKPSTGTAVSVHFNTFMVSIVTLMGLTLTVFRD